MTLQAYVDESGVKGTDPVFVLAGFIANDLQWRKFSEAWTAHLKASPSIRYLKMNEAAKLDGEFRFWKAAERDEKLMGFVEIIKNFPPVSGIYFITDLIAWEQLIDHPVANLRDPHFLTLFGMIFAICHDVLDSGSNEPLEIIFDEHAILGPRITSWYPAVREMCQKSTEYGMGEMATVLPPVLLFRDDQQFVPLQAADVLAWFLRHSFKQRLPGLESVWQESRTGFEWLTSELLPHIPHSKYATIWGHERIGNMQELSKNMKHDPELVEQWRKFIGVKPRKPKNK